jgi:DNA recombination protein RmuC
MEGIWLLIGLFIGAGGMLLAARRWVAAMRRDRDAAVTRERDAERKAMEAQAGLREELARLEAERTALERTIGEQAKSFFEGSDGLIARVEKATGEAVEAGGKRIVDLAEARVKTVTTEAGATFEKKALELEQAVEPVKRQMGEVQQLMVKLEEGRQQSSAELGERIQSLVGVEKELAADVGSLERALRQPHARGRWGEFHLRRACELAGMVEHCDFDVQSSFTDGDATVRPDLVVKLPEGKRVVVDAKAPLDHYLEALQAKDAKQESAHLQLFARGVRAHVKALGRRDYGAYVDGSPEFVFLFMPGDHFLTAALEHDGSLVEDAIKERVFIVGPTNYMAALRTIAFCWQQQQLAAEAQAIAKQGQYLHDALCRYLRHVQTVERRLNSLNEAFNASVGSLDARLLPAARKFPELGAVAADSELPEVKAVTTRPRALQAPEAEDGAPGASEDVREGTEKPANSGEAPDADGADDAEAA